MEIYVGNLLILSFNRFTPKRSKTITLSNLCVQLSNFLIEIINFVMPQEQV